MNTGRVEIVPHDARWLIACDAEIVAIGAAIEPARAYVDHVGSTAVPGLAAKPVIDLLIAPMTWDDAGAIIAALARIGYRAEKTSDKEMRHFLTRAGRSEGIEAFHLHIAPRESSWGNDMLVFRDELASDPQLATRYAAIKRDLAAAHCDDLDAYTDGKSDFIGGVLGRVSGALGNDRLLTHQRAELDRAQTFRNLALVAQFCVALVAAISVYSNDNGTLLSLALVGFISAGLWQVFERWQRTHRSAGDQARRVVLLASGLDARFSAEQRRRIFDGFAVSIEKKALSREETYFASRTPPGYRRLAELIEESAYWTRDIQGASAFALQILLFLVLVTGVSVLWFSLPALPVDTSLSLARVLVASLVFLASSDVIGAILSHREAARTIGYVLQRIETAAARSYPDADVLLLMSDYNAVVESAPLALPGLFSIRKGKLTRRWRSYLETKRR